MNDEKNFSTNESLEKVSGGVGKFSKGVAGLVGCLSIGSAMPPTVSNLSVTHAHKDSADTESLNDLYTDEQGVTYCNGGKKILSVPDNDQEIFISNQVEEIVPPIIGRAVRLSDDFSCENKSFKLIVNISLAKLKSDNVVYANGGKTIVAIPENQKEIVISKDVEKIMPSLRWKKVILDENFSIEGKNEKLISAIKNSNELEFKGMPIERLFLNYDKNKRLVDLLPTDEEGLKPYLKIKTDKYISSDAKFYKNLSSEDYLEIRRQVTLILIKSLLHNYFPETNIQEMINVVEKKEITNELLDGVLKKFDSVPRRERARVIYDWITENISYNEAQLSFESYGRVEKNSPGCVFKNKTGICLGFAKLSKIMMRLAGVPCVVCYGFEHAYNLICIEDENEKGKMVWGLMDSCYGSDNLLNEELNQQAQKQLFKVFLNVNKDPLYGKVTKRLQKAPYSFPTDETLRKQISNDSDAHEILKFIIKDPKSGDKVVNFHVHAKEKILQVSESGSTELTIPKTLQNLDDFELRLPLGLKTLNLGESKFSKIHGLENLEKVTISESNTKYKDEDGTIIDKDTGSIVFSDWFEKIGEDIFVKKCDSFGNVTIPPYLEKRSGLLLIDPDLEINTLNLGKSEFTEISDTGMIKNITVSAENKQLHVENNKLLNKNNECLYEFD